MKRDAVEARRHETAVAELNARHARQVEALEQRLAWYRDNQAILDQDRETLTRQAAQIRQLKAQLDGGDVTADGGDATAASGGAADPADAVAGRQQRAVLVHHLAVAKRRIAELEKDLAAAQESLDKRRPDSLASLIRAAKGADGAVGEPAQLLQELERVRAEAHEAAEAHDRQLRALRQQHELLKAQYAGAGRGGGADGSGSAAAPAPPLEQQVARAATGELSTTVASAAAAKREAALRARADALDKELERVRAFYVAKVKELSAQVKELQAVPLVGQQHAHRGVAAPPGARATQPASVAARPGTATPSRRPAAAPSSSAAKLQASAALPPHGTHDGCGGEVSGGEGSAPVGDGAGGIDGALQQRLSLLPGRGGHEASNAPVRRSPQRSARDARVGDPDLDENAVRTSGAEVGRQQHLPRQEQQQQIAMQAALDDVSRRLTSTEESVRVLSEENKRLRNGTAAAAATAALPLTPTPVPSVNSDVARLSAAIALLEARAEARELELVRAERAALSVQDGQLDVERARFREALRVKDEALAQCRHELMQMMTALQAKQSLHVR